MRINGTLQGNYRSTMLDSLSYLFGDYDMRVFGASKLPHLHPPGSPNIFEDCLKHDSFVNTSRQAGHHLQNVMFF